jgi:hypothetical protein
MGKHKVVIGKFDGFEAKLIDTVKPCGQRTAVGAIHRPPWNNKPCGGYIVIYNPDRHRVVLHSAKTLREAEKAARKIFKTKASLQAALELAFQKMLTDLSGE